MEGADMVGSVWRSGVSRYVALDFAMLQEIFEDVFEKGV